MIVVALPAYNEAEAVPRLLARFREVAPLLNDALHVIVVDDGSRDGTAEAAERSADGLSLHVVRHAANRGLHGALDTGLRSAIDAFRGASGPAAGWIVTMDADDTHPPSLIPGMIARGERGADVVIASRFREGAEWHGGAWSRAVFSYGVSWLFRLWWPMRGVRDYTCGYRAYRADVIRKAYERYGDAFVSEPSFACMPDVLWKISRLGVTMAEVPLLLFYDRKPGVSKMNVSRTIRRTLALIVRRRFGW
jgi:dolichol-phosphate mannosyltransferase